MTRRISILIAILLLLTVTASAAPLVRELPLYVKVKGSVEVDGGADTYVFDALAGYEIKISLSGKKSKVLPDLAIQDPQGTLLPIPAPSSSGKIKLPKTLLTVSGRYVLRVTVTRAGDYTLKLKTTAAKIDEDVAVPASGQGELTFMSLAGGSAKVKAKQGVKKGPIPIFESWTDPGDGAVTPASTSTKSYGFKLGRTKLAEEGEYAIAVRLEGGVAGTANVEVDRSDPAKSGTIREEDLIAGQVQKIHWTGPDVDDEGWTFRAALLDTGSIDAVILEIPGLDDRDLERNASAGQWRLTESFDDQASLDAAFPDGTYVLRIQREDEEDETLQYVVGDAYPDAAFITAPTDGFIGASLTPTITWSAVANVTGYDVEIARQGLGYPIFQHSTDDGAETSCEVTPGVLVDGPVYAVAVATRSDGLKVTQRTTLFSTSSTGLGYSDEDMERQFWRRPGVNFSQGERDYHHSFLASFAGQGVRSAVLEWDPSDPFPVTSFRPVAGSADFEINLRWEIPVSTGYANAIAFMRTLLPDGDYQFRLTYIDGSEVVTDPITIGGHVPLPSDNFKSAAADGTPANVLTPSWWYKQDEDHAEVTQRKWIITIDEPATGEVVYEEEMTLVRSDPAEYFEINPWTVPDGVLEKKKEYRLTWTSDNEQNWTTKEWTTFTTGSDLNRPNLVSVSKDHERDGEGEDKYVFLAQVVGQTIRRARVRDPEGNLLAMENKGNGLFRLKVAFATEEDLDQALPDGTYNFDFEYDDGTPDQLRFFRITGEFPLLPTIAEPTHREKRVAKDTGVSWTYPTEDAEGSLGFHVRITDVSRDAIVYNKSLNSTVRDTKVPSTQKLRGGKWHELEVYVLGITRKNAISILEFKTR